MKDTSIANDMSVPKEPSTANHRRSTPSLLRTVLRENAAFSLVTGIGLVVAAPWIDTWLGLKIWRLVVAGVGLIGYSIFVWTGSAIDSLLATTGRIAVAGDTGWVVAAMGVVAFTSWLTAQGEVALLIISVPVLLFAIGQAVGLRRLGGAAH